MNEIDVRLEALRLACGHPANRGEVVTADTVVKTAEAFFDFLWRDEA